MKLPEHVDKLRYLIEVAFDKYFARQGIGKNKQLDIEKLPKEVRSKRLRFEEMLENHIGETGNYEHAREKLIDELTFTLFNRLAAVKVMEAANLFPPILTKQPEHGDRSFGHKAWLEMNPHMRSEELEGIREYLKTAFNELGKNLFLFSNAYPYALLPDAISLNEIIDAFNMVEKDTQVGFDIWQNDDVLGWMYESYNNAKKKAHKDSGDKTEYNKVSLQSQVYTPRWVVQFLVDNSLGKLYLEMYPDSEIKRRYKIANAPQTSERKPKPLHEIKIIDPACGSGNFLLYAFDFFYELYVDQIEHYDADYEEKNIPKLIIENNLYGIDLDDRAVQLAQLGLFIKAKKKNRTNREFAFHVVSSDFYLPEYETVKDIFEPQKDTDEHGLDDEQKRMFREIWDDLKLAYKFGSLIRIDERINAKLKLIEERAEGDLFGQAALEVHKSFTTTFFSNLKMAIEQYAQVQGNTFLTNKARDAITFLELITTEYDVATANPPYTDSSDFGPELKVFIEGHYKNPYKFNTNLYTTFIKRCYELTAADGKVAMIHPDTFMFIKTFEDVRKFILDNCKISILTHLGPGGVFGSSLRVIDPVLYVLEKMICSSELIIIDLRKLRMDSELEKSELEKAIITENYRRFSQNNFKVIKSYPFIYWISDLFRNKFKNESVKDVLKNCQGLATGNNNRFLRFWWEIVEEPQILNEKSWVFYAKGGPFKKWYGNIWCVVNWKSNGFAIKNYVDSKGKQRSRPQNENLYRKEGITYSASGGRPSYRYLPSGCIFDVGGSSIFPIKKYHNIYYSLAFFNSKLSKYIIECLNPTRNKQVGDVERIPFAIPSLKIETKVQELTQKIISILKKVQSSILYENGLYISPLRGNKPVFEWDSKIKRHLYNEAHILTQVLINEAIINEIIFEVYDLTEHDKAMVLAKEGESIGGLPVSPEARDAYLVETEATKDFPLDAICDFINTLPTKEFTAEERETIESGFSSLYQSNNALEEFCIRHQVNPINVWYWFKQSNVIPKQRMHSLAMEFLTDMVREILMEDEDGVIPLVPNAGEKVLLDRIEEKLHEKGFSTAQFSTFDTVLGRPIQEYLNKYFFAELSDYLNLFMYLPKTPFIWHLSSGPEQGFDCYIIIYKWSRDNLMRLRSVYIEHRERSLINRQSDLSGNESVDAQNEKDRIFMQLKEIETFKKKIDELLAEGYNPILDDGVGKNIAPLQKKKMIPYEVLNEGQLKKYLDADW